LPKEARLTTQSQNSKQTVENEAATISRTTNDPNLVTGNASNKTNPTENTTTTAATAAIRSATLAGNDSTSPRSSRVVKTAQSTLFPPNKSTAEAAIGNVKTEQAEAEAVLRTDRPQ